MERAFATLQKWLPPELRLAEVQTREAANVYLRKVFVPAYDERFGKPAEEEASSFAAYAGPRLRKVLRVREDC